MKKKPKKRTRATIGRMSQAARDAIARTHAARAQIDAFIAGEPGATPKRFMASSSTRGVDSSSDALTHHEGDCNHVDSARGV